MRLTARIAARTLGLISLALLGACEREPTAPNDDSSTLDASSPDAAAEAAPNDAAASADAALGPLFEPPLPRPVRAGREGGCVLAGTRSDAPPRIEPQPLLVTGLTRAFGIVERPGSSDVIFVFEQHGLVHRVDTASAAAGAQVVLDLSARLACCEDGGLRGLVAHPDYVQNGFLFAFTVVEIGGTRRARVVRFTADPSSDRVDPGSELRVLDVALPGRGNEGGPLMFDADGMLLIGLGDGGEVPALGDPRRPTTLLGALLRIDVSQLDAGGYVVPADNPFAGEPDVVVPEVYAFGLRDPRHCELERATGSVWCNDRGATYSELNQVVRGRHHGWPEIEANVCVGTGRLCTDARFEGPRASYRHFEGACGVLGAAPLAGADPLLDGAVLYADACSGALFGVFARGSQAGKRGRMGAVAAGVRAVGRDGAGRGLLIDGEGRLARVTVAPDGEPGTFPERLSETGCYADLAQHRLTDELVEFRINSPLWSDGTIKRRFVYLPPGERIEAQAIGPWSFPTGAILVKEFAFAFDDRDASSVRPVETRFMLKRADGWEFHGYRWNEDATDAELVAEDESAEYVRTLGGVPVTQRYLFPGPQTCPVCHSGAPGRVLGPRTEQLHKQVTYAGDVEASEQLEVLAALGLFDMPAGTLARLPDPADPSLPLETRARSYLHGNCAHCHRPEGWSSPDLTMDLRFELSFAESRTCGEEPSFFREGRSLIAPGEPEQSAILIRMRDTGIDRMPPVATTVVDPLADELVSSWIASLRACP